MSRREPSRAGVLGALAVMVALAVAEPVAVAGDNPDLERARALIERVQLDQAIASLDAALARGGNDPEQMQAIYRLLGEAAAGVGDDARSRDAFSRLLAIDPAATLDDLVSPKLQTAFDAASQSAPPGGYLILDHTVSGGPGVTVTLERRADTLGLVVAAELVYRIPGGTIYKLRGEGEGAIEIALPGRPIEDVVLYAVDGRGNRLRAIPLGSLGGGGDTGGRRPIHRQAWSWATVSGVLFVGGLAFTFARASARSDLDAIIEDDRDHFFSDAQDAEKRVNRYTALAITGYGLAAATAITGIVFVMTAPDPTTDRVRVAPIPMRGGGALALEVSF